MDYRRIIAFGKSSFVVSLPKDWMTENHLQKGDFVFMEKDFDKLTLTPKKEEHERIEKKTVIDVDNKDIKLIKREISAAFVNYNDYIVIQGKKLHEISKDIVKVIHNLIALEIMEQSSEKIVARDFLKVKDIRIVDYFKKADIITRSMFVDLLNPEFDNFDELIERQNNVKRVYLLLLKVFKALSRDPILIKNIDISLEEIFKYYKYTFSIQKIANSLKVMAENFATIKDKKTKNLFRSSLKSLELHYLSMMKAVHTNNKKLAYELSGVRDKEIEKINNFELKNNKEVNIIFNRFIWTYYEIHDLLHVLYN